MVYERNPNNNVPQVAPKPAMRSALGIRQSRSHSLPTCDKNLLNVKLQVRRGSAVQQSIAEETNQRSTCDSLVPISILDEDISSTTNPPVSLFSRERTVVSDKYPSQRRPSQRTENTTKPYNQTDLPIKAVAPSELRHKPAVMTQDTSIVRYHASRRHQGKRKSSQDYQSSKAKLTQLLKTTQLEQLSKLQNKHQQECELLDDIRNFGKQRSQLDKDYGQALQKLVVQYQKRESTPSVETEDTEKKTVQVVWKSVLEATDKAGQARIAASEYYKNNIYEAAKNCKAQKDVHLKKCQDLLNNLQNEITETVKELTKAKKKYYDLEQVSQNASDKYQEVNDRLRKNQTSLFKSKAGLEKAFQKLQQKCDESSKSSTVARNEYLLMLAAANCHQKRYYETDMPEAMRILDGNLFAKFQDYLGLLCKFELQACTASQEAHTHALHDAGKISREYNIRCFLHENPVFEWGPRYEFEPCGNDEVGPKLTPEQPGEDNSLNREARKWTTRVVRDERNLQRLNKIKQGLESLSQKYAESPELNIESVAQETEVRLEKCREDLRRTETNHIGGEARLQLLRDVNVNVDTWLESARAQAAKEMEQSVTTPGFSTKRRSLHNRTLPDDHHTNGAHTSVGGDESFFDEDFVDDETFDEDDHVMMVGEKDDLSLPSSDHSRNYPVTCTVTYPYQATRTDELTITVGDRIEVVEDGDLDQWVKARDATGRMGYIPENYLEFPANPATPHHHYALPPGDYNDTLGSSSSGSITSGTSSLTTNSSGNDREVSRITSGGATHPPPSGICLAKAIYEYEACSEEELSFPEGAIISIISKDDNGIDDGWWKGELNGKIGVFPGLVVEDMGSCNSNVKEPASPEDSPTSEIPPSFRPPTPSSSPSHSGKNFRSSSPDSGVNTHRHSPLPHASLEVPDIIHERTNSAPASPIYTSLKPKPNRSAPAPPKRPVSFIRTNNR
uniref:F-BAR and double SH3 domains protein 2 isoform X2 n=1 Tax=Ciona intestinalis TaxID=7719 RepID=UPI000180CB78|nr:F-BAR and double SH3 domains protein 2 isoform X2 [Ciona intestinalis]|eukprot:XP_009857655.1 F-BAR and double SH3 domains protein 2 isoform X2 [Ciona intestinalis]